METTVQFDYAAQVVRVSTRDVSLLDRLQKQGCLIERVNRDHQMRPCEWFFAPIPLAEFRLGRKRTKPDPDAVRASALKRSGY